MDNEYSIIINIVQCPHYSASADIYYLIIILKYCKFHKEICRWMTGKMSVGYA